MDRADDAEGVEEARPEDFVQSVGRAMRVLEVVAAEPGLPVKAIARRCELNVSTTYHLVRTLAYEGYLHRLPDGTYLIGDELARRFHDMRTALTRPANSNAVLRHLSARTGLSAYLGCFDAARLTVVDAAEGPGTPYLEDFEVGLGVSAHATAMGKALLGVMPTQERQVYLSDTGMRRFTANTCTDPQDLESQLGYVRPGRVVQEHGEFRDGVSCAATVVQAGASTLVVGVGCRGEEVPRRVRTELMLAARDLEGDG